MQDHESTDLEGAAYLSAEQEAWEVEWDEIHYNDYDHDYDDVFDPDNIYCLDCGRSVCDPGCGEHDPTGLPLYVPSIPLPDFDSDDIPF